MKLTPFLNFLEKFDSFGQEQKFNISKKEKFKTPLGGFLYFLILAVFLSNFIQSVITWINKSNPDNLISMFHSDEPIILKKNELILSIAGFDNSKDTSFNNKTFDLNEYFDLYASYVKWEGRNMPIKKKLNIDNCEKTFPNKTLLFNKFCLIPNTDLEISGEWSSEISIVYLDIKFCDPKTKLKKCKGREGFFKFLKETKNNNFLQLNIDDKVYNPWNYSDPFQVHERNFFIANSNKLTQFFEINYIKNQCDSDIGGVFNLGYTVSDREIKSTEGRTFFSEEITDDMIYVKIVVKAMPIKKIYMRIYEFLNDWIEDAAVLSGWLTVVIDFLYSFYNDYRFKWFKFSRIVSFEGEEEDIKKMLKNNLSKLPNIHKEINDNKNLEKNE